jgi:hypothetical protein
VSQQAGGSRTYVATVTRPGVTGAVKSFQIMNNLDSALDLPQEEEVSRLAALAGRDLPVLAAGEHPRRSHSSGSGQAYDGSRRFRRRFDAGSTLDSRRIDGAARCSEQRTVAEPATLARLIMKTTLLLTALLFSTSSVYAYRKGQRGRAQSDSTTSDPMRNRILRSARILVHRLLVFMTAALLASPAAFAQPQDLPEGAQDLVRMAGLSASSIRRASIT